MSKCLVVLKRRMPIPSTDRSFNAIYGAFYIHDEYFEVGDQESIILRSPIESIEYLVDGLEGTWLEPVESSQDILVL